MDFGLRWQCRSRAFCTDGSSRITGSSVNGANFAFTARTASGSATVTVTVTVTRAAATAGTNRQYRPVPDERRRFSLGQREFERTDSGVLAPTARIPLGPPVRNGSLERTGQLA